MNTHFEQEKRFAGPTDICEYLEIKRRALRTFLQATASLQPAIEEDNPEKVDTLMEMRETCIRTINAVDDRIKHLSQEDPRYYVRLSAEGRKRLGTIAGAIEAILDQLKDLNSECIMSATRRITMIQDEIAKSVQKRRQVQSGYTRAQAPRFLDITS